MPVKESHHLSGTHPGWAVMWLSGTVSLHGGIITPEFTVEVAEASGVE